MSNAIIASHGDALNFALEGDRVRRASAVLEREGLAFASALRRAMPFLSKRKVPVTLAYARAIPVGTLLADLPAPLHVIPIVADPLGARGALVLDAVAIAMFLDGTLGGDGSSLPTLSPTGLTAAQSALMARVGDGIVRALGDVLRVRAGVTLKVQPPSADDADTDGAFVACVLECGEGENIARVALVLAKEALLVREDAAPATPPKLDPNVAHVVSEVEVELVAELGRLRMPLGALAALRVGDTLRLEVAVGSAISVRARGQTILQGRPTTHAGRIAIKVEGGHER